jgi:hypothetical protein
MAISSQAKVAENETILQAHTYGEVTPNGVRQLAEVLGLDGAGAGLMLAISKINGDIIWGYNNMGLYHFDSGNFGEILSGKDSCDPVVARVYGNLGG